MSLPFGRARVPTLSGAPALRQTHLTTALLIGALLIAVSMRLPALHLPLERDEGAYAYIAWSWLRGALPYRDLFDHKPPLIYLLYLPPLLLAEPSALAIRLWNTLLFLLSLWLLFLVGRRIWAPPVAALATLLFAAIGSAFQLQGLILNTDQALVLPVLAALWSTLCWRATGQWRYALLSGAAVAAAVLIKPVAVLLGPVALIASLGRPRNTGRALAGLLAGALLVALPCLAPFLIQNAWDDLWFALVTYNRLYARESQARWSLSALLDLLAPLAPLLLTALGGAVTLRRHAGWPVAGWAAALLLAALLSLRPYIHYFYPMLPVLTLLAAACIAWLWRQHERTPHAQVRSGIAALLLVGLLTAPVVRQNLQLIGATPATLAEGLYGDEGKHYFAPAPLVADYIRRHSAPDAPIHIFAAEPEIYLLAQRRAVSRYIYDYPLALLPAARAELRQALVTNPPTLIVTYYGVRADGFWEVVQAQNFEKLAQIGGYEIFGRP